MIKILIFLCFINLNLFSIEDLNKVYNNAINSWFDGRVSDAIGGLEYIVYNSTDDKLTLEAGKDLVVLLNEANENSLALAYIAKLNAISSNDPYLEFEKAMAYFALNKYKQANDSFDNVFTMTADEDIIYYARFMKAIVDIYFAGYDKSLEELQTVYKKYPSLLAPSTYLASYIYGQWNKKLQALNFIKDTLKYDPMNIQALIDLANTYEETGYSLPAWQAYYTLKEIDYFNPFFSKKAEKLIKKLNKNPDDMFYWTRIAWPVHNEVLKTTNPKKDIKIGLYSDSEGNLSLLDSFYFISNVDFEINDSVLGRKYLGKNNMQYKVEYIKSNRLYQLRDNSNSIVYSTRVDFDITLKNKNGVILIKSPSICDKFYGVNKGDKEVSNKIEIKVSTDGMNIINHTYVEQILPSMISSIKGPKKEMEFLKAAAIIIRTWLYQKNSTIKYMPDNNDYFEFKGLQYEKKDYIEASNMTEDIVIMDKKSYLYDVSYSLNCAGKTYSGVDDNSSKPEKLTPYSIKRWILFDFYKKPAYSIPEDQTELSNITWTIFLEPKWIEDRVNEKYKIGKIKNIFILKRDEFGIVKSVKIEGTAGDVIINGEDDINKFLAANKLRSNLFIISPVLKGNFPQFFIVKGVGTGNFKGMCIYGANYLAKNMGYKYNQILKHYFPDSTIVKK